MKTNCSKTYRPLGYIIILLMAVSFFSCERSENTYTKEESVIQINIPVSATTRADVKSSESLQDQAVPFSGSTEHQFSDVLHSADGMRTITSITPNEGSILSISNVLEENEISSLYFEWGYKYMNDEAFTMMSPIDLLAMNYTLKNETFELIFDEISHQMVADLNNPNITFRFTITGNCNSDLEGIATLEIPVIVESEIVSTRFELF